MSFEEKYHVKFKFIRQRQAHHQAPAQGTNAAAGFDLRADAECEIPSGERLLVPTNLAIEMPAALEAQVRPRSGLALKHGVTVLNSPGTIDADYRGEIQVLLVNHGRETFQIAPGDRIAQLVFAKVAQCQLEVTSELSSSERGAGGFGSTGVS